MIHAYKCTSYYDFKCVSESDVSLTCSVCDSLIRAVTRGFAAVSLVFGYHLECVVISLPKSWGRFWSCVGRYSST
jgi:hypothetical protein